MYERPDVQPKFGGGAPATWWFNPEKARRIGITAMVGGKDKTRIRNATPMEFRNVLLSIARSAGKEPTP
jgi:hypothetical protein